MQIFRNKNYYIHSQVFQNKNTTHLFTINYTFLTIAKVFYFIEPTFSYNHPFSYTKSNKAPRASTFSFRATPKSTQDSNCRFILSSYRFIPFYLRMSKKSSTFGRRLGIANSPESTFARCWTYYSVTRTIF